MAVLMARPLTLAVDIDILLSSGPALNVTSGPEPNFTYTVGEQPASASVSPPSTANVGGSFPKQVLPDQEAFHTRCVWLRPGVRRFLLAVSPYFKPVLLVRRRCSSRRCFCDGGRAHILSSDGGPCNSSSRNTTSRSGGVVGGVGAECGDGEQRVGGCGPALLAAALPHIDPDGQFFCQRAVFVRDHIRPRSAQVKPSRASCPGESLTSGAAAATCTTFSAAAAGAAAAGTSDAFSGLHVADLTSLPLALGEPSSSLLVVTVAERNLFGGLEEHVVQCQAYRKEYGKYDDLLDCLASAVLEVLAEASVAQGLRRLGLLHSKLQPSPVMQALQAQAALRQGQQLQLQQEQRAQGKTWAHSRSEPGCVAVAAAAGAAGQLGRQAPCHHQQQQQQPQQEQLQHHQQQQKQQQQPQQTGIPRKAGTGATGGRSGRRSSSSGRESDTGGSSGGAGSSGGGVIVASASTLSLPPIPEFPLLEIGANWPDDPDGDVEAAAGAPSASGGLGPGSPEQSSSSNSSSSYAGSGSHALSPSCQSRSNSSPPALCTLPDSTSAGSRPSRSSVGSVNSSAGSSSTAATPPPPLAGGRRMAWDEVPTSEAGLVPSEHSSAAAAMLQSLRSKPLEGVSATAGGGSGSGSSTFFGRFRGSRGGELGWRPGSFPAAAKPHVTRHISDAACQSTGGGAAAVAAAVSEASGLPASPLSTAASAVATATSRLLSRILGGRHKRRCRPSDVVEDGGGAVDAIAADEAARRSAVSATHESRALSVTGEVCFVSARQGRSASATATVAPFAPPACVQVRPPAAAAAVATAAAASPQRRTTGDMSPSAPAPVDTAAATSAAASLPRSAAAQAAASASSAAICRSPTTSSPPSPPPQMPPSLFPGSYEPSLQTSAGHGSVRGGGGGRRVADSVEEAPGLPKDRMGPLSTGSGCATATFATAAVGPRSSSPRPLSTLSAPSMALLRVATAAAATAR